MKRLVACCDGTWSKPDQDSPTNVVALRDRVPRRSPDGVEQRVHYQAGVGTAAWERLVGALTGYGLSRDVQEVYAFVVAHFEPGDEIYLVGFSRGAYTARSVAGLIRNVGVLRREEAGRLEEAYDLYRDRDPARAPEGAEAVEFRRRYSQETRIRCVGVWDTVGALGIPLSDTPVVRLLNRRWRFHDTQLSSRVETAFQALAVDERREPFKPTLWQPVRDLREPGSAAQRVEQVWFAGSHSDVGGGYRERGLADLTLWWMVDRLRSAGLAVEPGPDRDPAWSGARLHDSRRWLFRLLPAWTRRLGLVDPDRERLASSVLERERADASYRPANVAAYLADGGPVEQL